MVSPSIQWSFREPWPSNFKRYCGPKLIFGCQVQHNLLLSRVEIGSRHMTLKVMAWAARSYWLVGLQGAVDGQLLFFVHFCWLCSTCTDNRCSIAPMTSMTGCCMAVVFGNAPATTPSVSRKLSHDSSVKWTTMLAADDHRPNSFETLVHHRTHHCTF